MRVIVSSGSPFEDQIAFSRAVRCGPMITVSGTAPIAPKGEELAKGDVYLQTKRCLEIGAQALANAGVSLDSVMRSRLLLVDITRWQDAARAHREAFHATRPACTFFEVNRFIDPDWLVEVELDAYDIGAQ